jgi:hypothetical protein
MSVTAEILKYPLLKIARARVHRHAAKVIEVPAPRIQADGPMLSLVRQLFFPGNGLRRTRILFAAAGPETDVFAFAQSAGQALSEISGASVALVERHAARGPIAPLDEDQQERGPNDPGFWRRYASQVSERLWRVKADVLPLVSGERARPEQNSDLPFDFFLLAAPVSDSMMPLLCRNCEGAVLILTANRTRRESALQAKRVLEQCDAELLGTVLEGRQFPIPESIYRRL